MEYSEYVPAGQTDPGSQPSCLCVAVSQWLWRVALSQELTLEFASSLLLFKRLFGTQLMDRVSPLTMMRLAPLLTLLTPLVAGFGPSQIASPQTALLASRTEPTWSKYKHDFVDPITPHEQPSGLHEPDSKKRAIADEFWLKQFEDDKDKMHEMMSKDHESRPPLFATDETWDHYKHEFIDPQV